MLVFVDDLIITINGGIDDAVNNIISDRDVLELVFRN